MSKITDCVVLVDDDFMNKDVSELNTEDYYLFHTNGNKLWLYKNSVIVASGIDAHGDEYAFRVPYIRGTLQQYVDDLTNL